MSSQRPGGIASLGLDLRALARALNVWAMRDDSKPQPQIREAANTAMDCIDRMLTELHTVRAALMTEVRRSDDASVARPRHC